MRAFFYELLISHQFGDQSLWMSWHCSIFHVLYYCVDCLLHIFSKKLDLCINLPVNLSNSPFSENWTKEKGTDQQISSHIFFHQIREKIKNTFALDQLKLDISKETSNNDTSEYFLWEPINPKFNLTLLIFTFFDLLTHFLWRFDDYINLILNKLKVK